MARLANTKENHRLLNIGDMFKDANTKHERIKTTFTKTALSPRRRAHFIETAFQRIKYKT